MNIFGLTFFGKDKYNYIWIPFFRQIRIYSSLPKNNTIIRTDIGKYKYDYYKQNMFIDVKAIKV